MVVVLLARKRWMWFCPPGASPVDLVFFRIWFSSSSARKQVYLVRPEVLTGWVWFSAPGECGWWIWFPARAFRGAGSLQAPAVDVVLAPALVAPASGPAAIAPPLHSSPAQPMLT